MPNHGRKRETNTTKVAPATVRSRVARRLGSKLYAGVDGCWRWLGGPGGGGNWAGWPGWPGAGWVTGALAAGLDADLKCAPQFVQKSEPTLMGAWQFGHIADVSSEIAAVHRLCRSEE